MLRIDFLYIMLLMNNIKKRLNREVELRNNISEISSQKPDPLLVAFAHKDEYIALICALFSYGNARLIVKFLQSLDFTLLDMSDDVIKKELLGHYYRFQTSDDVASLFIALKRLKQIDSIENIVYKKYKKQENILDGLWELIGILQDIYPVDTRGYKFLIGSVLKKINNASTYKRYMMYFRWMVRSDNIDMGLWKKIDKKDLIMPLDVHTFNVSRKLGLLKRKTYDLKACLELTETLKTFDENDPIKYDFALYRIGQEKLIV